MAVEFPLALIIKAVDRATEPLRQINQRISKFTAPVRKLSNGFRALADEAGLPRLVKGFAGVGRSLGDVGREVSTLALKVTALGAVAGFALLRIVRGSVEAGEKLGEMASQVGLSVDTYAQLQFAAGQANVSQEEFNAAMGQFNKRLGEAKAGSGPLLEFLKKVSPRLADQVRAAKSTEEALGLMTSAFEKVKDPSKRAALSAEAFGKSSLQMGQFLGKGKKALVEQRQRFLDLAGSQEAFAAGSHDMGNAMRETEAAFSGLRSVAAAALYPALLQVTKAVTALLVENRAGLANWARTSGAAISEWVKSGGLTRLIDGLRTIADTVGKVVDALGGLPGVLKVVALVMGGKTIASVYRFSASLWEVGSAAIPAVVRAALLLAPLLGSLGASLVPFLVAAAPFVAAAAAVGAAAFLIYRNWKPIKLFFKFLWEDIVDLAEAAWKKLQPIIDTVSKVMQLSPFQMAAKLGQMAIGGVSSLVSSSAARPALGAEGAKPGAAAPASQAHVQVDFNNLPAGARVTPGKQNSTPLDLSLGYSMVTP